MTLTGKTALVTGGARGQGAAHARALAGAGAHVVIADILDEEGQATAQELTAEGLGVSYEHLDVTSETEWAAVIDRIDQHHSCLDILVNNAGVMRVAPISEMSLGTWSLLQRVNLDSAFLGIRASSDSLARGGGGSIINIASTAAHRGAPGYAAYTASKAAIIGLTKVAAVELAPAGIRVNSISPGGVNTPMNDDEPVGGTSSGAPLGRRAEPDEISPLLVYLAGEGASYVTGADLLIDGGLTVL